MIIFLLTNPRTPDTVEREGAEGALPYDRKTVNSRANDRPVGRSLRSPVAAYPIYRSSLGLALSAGASTLSWLYCLIHACEACPRTVIGCGTSPQLQTGELHPWRIEKRTPPSNGQYTGWLGRPVISGRWFAAQHRLQLALKKSLSSPGQAPDMLKYLIWYSHFAIISLYAQAISLRINIVYRSIKPECVPVRASSKVAKPNWSCEYVEPFDACRHWRAHSFYADSPHI